jgi:hypothetical protein
VSDNTNANTFCDHHPWLSNCIMKQLYSICDLSVGQNVYSKLTEKILLVWKTIISGQLDGLRLSSHIGQKYFLERSNLLPTPSFICSNTLPLSLPLSLSASPLSCSFPTTLLSVFNPVMHYHLDHSINAFCKELFSFQRMHLHKTI